MEFKKIKGTVSGIIEGKVVVRIKKISSSGLYKWVVMIGSEDTFFEIVDYANTLNYAKTLAESIKGLN